MATLVYNIFAPNFSNFTFFTADAERLRKTKNKYCHKNVIRVAVCWLVGLSVVWLCICTYVCVFRIWPEAYEYIHRSLFSLFPLLLAAVVADHIIVGFLIYNNSLLLVLCAYVYTHICTRICMLCIANSL